MATIKELAEEYGWQPYEISDYCDLNGYPQEAALPAEAERVAREVLDLDAPEE